MINQPILFATLNEVIQKVHEYGVCVWGSSEGGKLLQTTKERNIICQRKRNLGGENV